LSFPKEAQTKNLKKSINLEILRERVNEVPHPTGADKAQPGPGRPARPANARRGARTGERRRGCRV